MSVELGERIALAFELQALYADYCACLDEGRFADWPDFFVSDCRYQVISRENFERGLPLATLAFESRAMLEDRVYGVTQTLFHAPYYQRHLVGPVRLGETADGLIRSEANYLVIRTKREEPSEVFNAGRYIDLIVRSEDRLRFRQHICVFDSELIPGAVIYPI